MILYHGSANLFDRFKNSIKKTFSGEKGVIPVFLSPTKEFAKLHAQNGYIYTVNVIKNNLFSSSMLYKDNAKYWPPAYDELTKLGKDFLYDLENGNIFSNISEYDNELFKSVLKEDYDIMETKEMMDWIRQKGFDGFFVTGDGERNIAIFDANNLEILSVENLSKTAQFKQNYDYGGNFIDKIKRRQKRKKRLKKISSLHGKMPDFSILENARIFKNILTDNNFLDENSHIIAKINPIKYIGSGSTADIFLTDENKILKICYPSVIRMYKDIYDKQFLGQSNLHEPKIYEFGFFTKNQGESIGYVVMEKLSTIYDFKKNINTIHVDRIKVDPIYDFILDNTEYPLLEIMRFILKKLKKHISKYISFHHILEKIKNLNINNLAKKILTSFKNNNPDVNDYTVNIISKAFYLDNDWLYKVTYAILQFYSQSYFDTHYDNLGFRNETPVFFDF